MAAPQEAGTCFSLEYGQQKMASQEWQFWNGIKIVESSWPQETICTKLNHIGSRKPNIWTDEKEDGRNRNSVTYETK